MTVSWSSWLGRVSRRIGGPRVLVLPLLRGVAVLSALLWIALAPPSFAGHRGILAAALGFLLWSVLLVAALWLFPRPTLRLNFGVLLVDLAFALTLIALTGGARSTLYLALLLIAGLQSYYYGIWRGVGVAAASALAYLAVVWPTVAEVEGANIAIRLAMLVGTAVGVGIVADVEQAERLKVLQLTDAIQARERFIGSVVESLRDGVVALDRDGRVVAWNAAMEERTDLAAAEVLGRPLFDCLPDFRGEPVEAPLRRLLRGEVAEFTLAAVECDAPRKGALLLNLKASLLRVGGRPAGAVLLTEDVTERAAFERSVRQAEKLAALGTLAAGLAHELNNPIGIISSRAELMLLDAESRPLPDELRDDLQVLHRNAQRVARIAHGLLSFARHSPGEQGPVDLNRVMDDTVLLVEKQMVKEGLVLRPRRAPGLPAVWGDANALQQVLMNLLTNARDAVTAGGEIVVETAPAPERAGARLIVRDTGHGIAAETLPHIFDPFFTTKRDGTGLGLAIAYRIVRDHGGTLDVQSQPGRGATFILTLPGMDGRERA